MKISTIYSVVATTVAAAAVEKRGVTGTALVHLNQLTGKPKHLAAGLIYGIPDTPNQIPDHFYTDVGFNYARAGGAQLPGNGWMTGIKDYETRFASTLNNYRTSRKYGANFNLLLHDLWGADSTETNEMPFPGDNGDWNNFDTFMKRLTSDIKSNDMQDGLIIDIWNEPDLDAFWKRPQKQYIDTWARAYGFLSNALPNVQTSGPSYSASPNRGNTWWTNWLDFVKNNGSIPDQWSWHMESGGGDMQSSVDELNGLLSRYSLPSRQINVNEYAVFDEQVPSAGAWWIAQLERVNAIGLRGNWLSTGALHDFLAGLLGKPNAGTELYDPKGTGYWPAAEYWVYNYYTKNMTGTRCATTTTDDKQGEVYAVVDENIVRLLVGARDTTGTFNIGLRELQSVGLPASGTLDIHTFAFDGTSDHFKEIGKPEDLGVYRHQYADGSLDFVISQDDPFRAYAFEFSRS